MAVHDIGLNVKDLSNQCAEKYFHFTDEEDLIMLDLTSSDDSDDSNSDVHVCNTDKCLNVTITEVLNASYGMYVWPCASVLSQFIWHNRVKVKEKTVLELGAGTALPSVVAAKCGSFTILSDGEIFSQALECGKQNMVNNKICSENYKVIELRWGNFSPTLLKLENVDIILGSDVFYEQKDFEDILVTVSYIMSKNPKAEFWCTYQERCSEWDIEHLLVKWDLCCKELSLESFGVNQSNFETWKISMDQKICMFVFTLCCESVVLNEYE